MLVADPVVSGYNNVHLSDPELYCATGYKCPSASYFALKNV